MRTDYKALLSLICTLSLVIFSLFLYGCGEGLKILIDDNKTPEIITDISGEITTDTTLSHIVHVTGDIIISNGTLTIEPGARIEASAENDNVTYVSNGQIAIVAINGGAIQANGTEDEPILFTSASETPAAGDWDRIRFIANGTNSSLTYCIIEYAYNGICIENPTGITGSSTPVIDHVIVRHTTGSAMYATDASNVQITNSVIYDCDSGIFFDGAASTGISNTLIYNVSAGIILAGNASKGFLNVVIDHVTLYNMDSSLISSPAWWTGYGIFACNNDAAELTLNNSIIADPDHYGLYCGFVWTINENYNCFFGGSGAVEGGTKGTNSLVQDPVFTDANANNFTLDASSPCNNAAGDGLDMGVN